MDGQQSPVEVGANEDELRLWLARETMRQGELRISAQTSSIQAMEARATALLGWCAGAGVALAAALANDSYRRAALAGLVLLSVAAVACIVALWPRPWASAGYRRSDILKLAARNELAFIESLGNGLERDGGANDKRLLSFARWLRTAWISLALAPVVAAAAWAAL